VELTRKLIKLKDYDGKEYELKVLTTGQGEKLFSDIKEAKDDEVATLKIQKDLLISSGLPAELADDLHLDDFKSLVEEVMGIKKN